MGKNNKKNFLRNNYEFVDNLIVNDETYIDYLERFKKICLSMFEWVNLPSSMNSMYLERCLYYMGAAALLKDKDYGFINTRVSSNGYINIYGLPTSLNCFSYSYQSIRKLYTGLKKDDLTELQQKQREFYEAILVMNNWDRTPTCSSMELFAYRLYEAEQTAFLNIRAQKTPLFILTNENQRHTFTQIYEKYNGNAPVIIGDKDNVSEKDIRCIKTDAPFIADKIIDYKKEIWNEALTFLRN